VRQGYAAGELSFEKFVRACHDVVQADGDIPPYARAKMVGEAVAYAVALTPSRKAGSTWRQELAYAAVEWSALHLPKVRVDGRVAKQRSARRVESAQTAFEYAADLLRRRGFKWATEATVFKAYEIANAAHQKRKNGVRP
jgi:hypothetical protein